MTSCTRGKEGGLSKTWCSKKGCVTFILHISSKCRQGGEGVKHSENFTDIINGKLPYVFCKADWHCPTCMAASSPRRIFLVPLPTLPHLGTNFCLLGCPGGGPRRPNVLSLVTAAAVGSAELSLFFIMSRQWMHGEGGGGSEGFWKGDAESNTSWKFIRT